jgi:aminoglycoside phosphotransferase family enzyme/predicted kinase
MSGDGAAQLQAQRRLVAALADPALHSQPDPRPVEIVETHISWVILAGTFAYKIKKALDLGFLDFSTLEKRRFACEEEIRLNRRTAPDIYLDVVAIGGSADAPQFGAGPVMEYAVRMRRFAREDGLDFLLARGALAPADIDAVAAMIAAFHAEAERSAGTAHGDPAQVRGDALANFAQMPVDGLNDDARKQLEHLRLWTLAEHARQAGRMEARRRSGFVRECHGDLHLANMVRLDGRIVAFDCIEFNPEMRWIDVINDIAFTLMDLRHRGRPDLARRVQDIYLENTGDWDGVVLLPFYLTYRAMVRAKVAAIRASGAAPGTEAHRAAMCDCHAHLQLACEFTRRGRGRLIITCGVSGSGKSHVSGGLIEVRDWIRLRADVERKRLAGLAPLEKSRSGPQQGLYTPAATARVYAHLAALAERLIGSGMTVIIDATFLKRAQRRSFGELAARLGVPLYILYIDAGRAELERRIAERNTRGKDPSEADGAVLATQIATAEPVAADEALHLLRLESGAGPDAAAVVAWIEGNDAV